MIRPATRVLWSWFKADEVRTDARGWAYNLALFRIAFLAVTALPIALDILSWTEQVLPGLPRDVWAPVSFYRYLSFDLLSSPRLAYWLAATDVMLIMLGLLGIFTRPSLALATVVSLYVFGLTQNQHKVAHHHEVIWFMALLAAGPSGRFLSVDSLWRAVRSDGRGAIEPARPGGTALATLRYVWILMGLLYLSAGVPKLHQALTAGWSTADNLRHLIWYTWFTARTYAPDVGSLWRVDALPSPVLMLAGIAVILFEVGFLALVLLRPLRPFVVMAGLAFHIGNGYALNIWFHHLTIAYVSLVDWTALGRSVSGLLGHPVTVRGLVPGIPEGKVVAASVGVLLIALQAGISGLLVAGDVAREHLEKGHPVRRPLDAFQRHRPVWPFDQYPSFARRWPTAVDIWEARVVLADGREISVDAAVYARAFGPMANPWWVTQSVLKDGKPDRQRTRSLDVLRLLWPHERVELRHSAVGVHVYRVTYLTNPSEPSPRAARLMQSFRIEDVQPARVAPASNPAATLIAPRP